MTKRILAKVGEEKQIIICTDKNDIDVSEYIQMINERPSNGNYIANSNGEWIIDTNKHIEQNIQKYSELLQNANKKIEILQDIIELDMQESNEDEQLKAWKKYRILLTRIDTNQLDITWPDKP